MNNKYSLLSLCQLLQLWVQNTINTPAVLASSPGFVRPSRGLLLRVSSSMIRHSKFCCFFGTNTMVMFYPLTGFGSALNIETLVAAAEKRETPIEVPIHCSIF